MINPADQNVFWSVFLVTVTLFWVSPANVASKCKYDCCYKPDEFPPLIVATSTAPATVLS
jgi:hypothetical protein